MSDGERKLADLSEVAPTVTLQRIRNIPTYEVMERDLQDLERATADELRAQGFFTFFSGLLIPTLITWVTATSLSPTAWAVYVSSSLVLGGFSLWFASVWLRAKKERPNLLQQIRTGTVTVTTTHEVRDS